MPSCCFGTFSKETWKWFIWIVSRTLAFPQYNIGNS
jgi:hypothetical protein